MRSTIINTISDRILGISRDRLAIVKDGGRCTVLKRNVLVHLLHHAQELGAATAAAAEAMVWAAMGYPMPRPVVVVVSGVTPPVRRWSGFATAGRERGITRSSFGQRSSGYSPSSQS